MTPYLKCKDHSVSQEEFQLLFDETKQMLVTSPAPALEKLNLYYKSEDYISHTDTKRNLFEKAYHFIRNITLTSKLKLINGFKTEHKQLLDIGCGTGDFLKKAQDNSWKVTGIEPDAAARTITKRKIGDQVFDIDKLARLPSHSFDVITLWHVLEHLPNLEMHIALFQKLLKSNGKLIIAVPNFNSYDAKHYKEYWAAYDVPRHLWHFSQKAISILFADVNMEVEKTKPMWFDSFYVALLSQKIKNKKGNAIAAFYHGFLSNSKAMLSNEFSSLIYVIKNK